MKKPYEAAKIELILFDPVDIIVTSQDGDPVEDGNFGNP